MSLFLLFAALLTLSGCRDKEPEQSQGPDLNIMVVFAPGQLGDRGYADSVMEGVGLLDATDRNYDHNILEVQFISSFNVADTKEALSKWVGYPFNSYYGNEYSRRLLILTEPYMVDWLAPVAQNLRDKDEVLLLKVNEDDVNAAAKLTGLGERIHGLNISATENIRRYCEYIDWCCTDQDIIVDELPIFRVFNEDSGNYHYRDGLVQTLSTHFGEDVNVYTFCLAEDLEEDVLLSTEYQTSVMEQAYELADIMEMLYEEFGMRFGVVDLGSANAGFDYYLLGLRSGNNLELLMLDATDTGVVSRFWVNRRFDKALLLWGYSWTQNPALSMPKMDIHSATDGYSEDNIPS